jgi:uncharacterized protein YjiS (DUF1127 family)
MPQPSTSTPQIPERALDTCRILHACATIDEPNRHRGQDSLLDKEVRDLGINPKDVRREIQDLFTSNCLLVPQIIIQELEDHLLESNPLLNEKNRVRLRQILGMIKGKVVTLATNINDFKLQEQIFSAIEKDANKRIKEIEIKTNTNLEGWEEKRKEASRSPMLKAVYKDPVCKTWQKICKFKDDVIKTAQGLKDRAPFLLNDFQIILTIKQRKALISTVDGDIKVLLAAYNQVTKEQQKIPQKELPIVKKLQEPTTNDQNDPIQ